MSFVSKLTETMFPINSVCVAKLATVLILQFQDVAAGYIECQNGTLCSNDQSCCGKHFSLCCRRELNFCWMAYTAVIVALIVFALVVCFCPNEHKDDILQPFGTLDQRCLREVEFHERRARMKRLSRSMPRSTPNVSQLPKDQPLDYGSIMKETQQNSAPS